MKTDRTRPTKGRKPFASPLLVLFVLFLALHPAGASESPDAKKGFSAKMVTTIQGHTSVARMHLQGEKMRMQVIGGRVFSTMIARYDKDLLWLLAPAAQQYQELPLAAMGRGVPHFFRTETRIDKTRIGEETVGGIKAVKYQARISTEKDKRTYDGFLWEAMDTPGLPLKWEEPATRTVVEWQERTFAEVPDALFEIPENYRKIEQPVPPPPPQRHQSLKTYPGKRPQPSDQEE
ncbi:MAG: hypothetical protein C4563_05460 [Desulfobulbus sp.]|nr:MAG: hypothetical protein C4563_05460 [Desulfobulbus sp.]